MPLAISRVLFVVRRHIATASFALIFLFARLPFLTSNLAFAAGTTSSFTKPADVATTLVYAGDENFAPYEYLDRDGKPAGLNIDLISAVAKTQGMHVQIQLLPWTRVVAGLRGGDIDVASMYRSRQREQFYEFGIPFELIYHEMFIRLGDPPLRSITDLDGKLLLVEKDAYSTDALTDLGRAEQLRPKLSEPDALAALVRGEGDVAIVSQAVGRPFESRADFSKKLVVTGPPVLYAEYSFVTRQGRRDIVERLNQGLAIVKASGEYDRIYRRWLRPDHSASLLYVVAWISGIAIIATILFLIWTFSLRRQVALKTQALLTEFQAREAAQVALAEAERNLRQSQKLEAIGRLAGGVAHDFNNILTAIVAGASLLREHLSKNTFALVEVDEILVATERAKRLTKQLLAFSRVTPMETQKIDLCQSVIGFKAMLQRLVGDNIRIEVSTPDSPLYVEVDLTLLEQTLLNLAANGRDAMHNGGRLNVLVTEENLTSQNKWSVAAGQYAQIVVSDSGTGMDEVTLARVFEPFFTTKALGHGTGLGLATVLASVTKLQGKVTVESTLGVGSSFRILLPRVSPPDETHSNLAQKILPTHGATEETILLVEDDEALRRLARRAFERAGYRVFVAKDGDEGEAIALTRTFSLVVTDVVMPNCGGPQMVERLRQHQPNLRVLYVSGYVNTDKSLELTAPGTAYLPKPYTVVDLLDRVRTLLLQTSKNA
jgi:signal transduction histidine kinase